METSVPSDNKPSYRKIGHYPLRTLGVIAVLSAFTATILWFRFVYHPPSGQPSPTPKFLLDRPKISPPSLPDNIISPLKVEGLNVTLSQDITLPQTAFLLNATPSGTFEDSAAKIAAKLGLKLVSGTADKITWSNQNTTLIAYKKDKYLSYFLNQLPDKTKPAPNLASALDTSQKFLTSINVWQPGYSINSQGVKSFAASGFDLVPTVSQTPDILEIPFHLLYNQTSIVIGQQEHPLVVRLGHDQQVVGFTLYPVTLSIAPITDYTLLAPDQIKALLSNNSQRLISISPLGAGASPASNTLSQANLSSAEPAYLFSSTQNLLYPAYLLKGTGSFSDGSQAALTFLLPALNPNYYQ